MYCNQLKATSFKIGPSIDELTRDNERIEGNESRRKNELFAVKLGVSERSKNTLRRLSQTEGIYWIIGEEVDSDRILAQT